MMLGKLFRDELGIDQVNYLAPKLGGNRKLINARSYNISFLYSQNLGMGCSVIDHQPIWNRS